MPTSAPQPPPFTRPWWFPIWALCGFCICDCHTKQPLQMSHRSFSSCLTRDHLWQRRTSKLCETCLLSMSEQARGLLTMGVSGAMLPSPLPSWIFTSVLPNWKAKLLPVAWHVGTWEGLGIGRPGFTFRVCHLWVMWSGDKSLILYAGAFVRTQCVNRINVCNFSETMSSLDHTPFFLNGCLCISFLRERVWLLQLWFWFQRWCQMRWFSLP